MRQHDGVDVVAVILAASVLVVVVGVVVVTIIDEARNQRFSAFGQFGSGIITDIVGSIVALLGAYIGYRVGERRNGNH